MSHYAFSRLVDALIAQGVSPEVAIAAAAYEAAHYVDSFDRMRKAGLDKTAQAA
jgi:hypothetical protein